MNICEYAGEVTPTIVQEVIAHQDKRKSEKLLEIMKDISEEIKVNKVQNGTIVRRYGPKLEDELMDLFGMNVVIKATPNTYNAQMSYDVDNLNHIFLLQTHRRDLENPDKYETISALKRRNKNIKKGTIDTKNAKLTGYFSEIEFTLDIDYRSLIGGMGGSPEEILGVLFHEVGHGFDSAMLMHLTTTTNKVLEEMVSLESNGDVYNKSTSILMPDGKSVFTPEEIKDLQSEGNNVIYSLKLFQTTIKHVVSLSSRGNRDNVTDEQMADNFAVKMGYGVHMLSMLRKIETLGYPTLTALAIAHSNIRVLVWTIITPFSIFISPALIPWVVTIVALTAIGSILSLTFNTYDPSEVRMKRIRQSLISKLKHVSKKERKVVLKELDYLQEIMDSTPNLTQSSLLIYKHLTSLGRSRGKQDQWEGLLEDMANSELSVMAYKLQENK